MNTSKSDMEDTVGVLRYFQPFVSEACENDRCSLSGAVQVHIPQQDQIVAVYNSGNEYRLWQSVYAEEDCKNALHIWLITPEQSFVHVACDEDSGVDIDLKSRALTLHGRAYAESFASYPNRDVLGNRFEVDFADDHVTENTLAAFYWHTLIPCVIEGKNDSYPDGYVLSTLAQSVYAGTYPDVDHEFQCKGRIACGGAFDLNLIKRMIEMQLRMMEEDPIKLWRNPCALQPNGVREYHVRRNSADNKTNADMFLISGNVEVIESAWLLIARTRDTAWLAEHIYQLEGAASLTEHCMDQYNRLWSDVFYEDQIIKDGTECMSACLAANSFKKLAELEALLGRKKEEAKYLDLEKCLVEMIKRPVPYGFWDEENKRFIDWLDRDGVVHDHIHLLANCLPVLFDYCTPEQKQCCIDVIHQNFEEYQRFPTFLSPRIQDYTLSEIGVPYDLCAAGRYWCWDAAYWAELGRGDILKHQVERVSEQARIDGFEMGERYDMNYIYYVDHRNWHGAERYYEYPNVYWWIVIRELIGINPSLKADILWRPQMTTGCSFTLEGWGVAGNCTEKSVTLTNLSKEKALVVELDASVIWGGSVCRTICLKPGETRTISAEETAQEA